MITAVATAGTNIQPVDMASSVAYLTTLNTTANFATSCLVRGDRLSQPFQSCVCFRGHREPPVEARPP